MKPKKRPFTETFIRYGSHRHLPLERGSACSPCTSHSSTLIWITCCT